MENFGLQVVYDPTRPENRKRASNFAGRVNNIPFTKAATFAEDTALFEADKELTMHIMGKIWQNRPISMEELNRGYEALARMEELAEKVRAHEDATLSTPWARAKAQMRERNAGGGNMNEIITLDVGNERFPVDCRELHERLGVGTEYRHWFPRQTDGVFVEGEDFNPVKNERVQNEGGREVSREVTSHVCTIGMAKELCMLQRNEKGRQVRRHLIAIEEQWNQPDAVIARALKMADAKLIALNGRVKLLEAKAEADAPKVMFAEAVSASDDSILIGELAKYMKQNGIKTGQNRLFERLRSDGFLCKARGEMYNIPTQRAMEMGLFEIKKNVIMTAEGPKEVKATAKVTGKGQVYFMKRYGNGSLKQTAMEN